MKNIILIIGTRPNFIKAYPIYLELSKNNYNVELIHTGQHYDYNMSTIFFKELKLENITFLKVGKNSQNSQIAKTMIKLEQHFLNKIIDLVLVFGDVSSTLAGSLTCNKMGIKLCHIESGNRSGDLTMPEEINRILVDKLSDLLFISELNGLTNLKKEGIRKPMYYIGNPMLDTYRLMRTKIDDSKYYESLNLDKNDYIVVTLHRPSNIDDNNKLIKIVNLLEKISKIKKIVFPLHPRRKRQFRLLFNKCGDNNKNIILTDSLGYIEFINLLKNSSLVITDSGGVQEETSFLNIYCITLRENTERPITITMGTNTLIRDLDENKIINKTKELLDKKRTNHRISLWDGKSAERCVKLINKYLT